MDQLRRYVRWRRDGLMSSTGSMFEIGGTVASALSRFERMGEGFCGSTRPDTAGNGCIMRLSPVPLYYHPDADRAIHLSGESSRTMCHPALRAGLRPGLIQVGKEARHRHQIRRAVLGAVG